MKGKAMSIALLMLFILPVAFSAPSLTVTSPQAGSTLAKGQTHTLSWTASPEAANYLRYIVLVDSNGEEVASIDVSMKSLASSSLSWKVPSFVPAGSYKIRIGTQPSATMVLAEIPVNIVEQTTPNRAPTISGISGPTNLKVGETGTWTITAYDPEGGPLSYRVVWGDEVPRGTASSPTTYSYQTATFTHIYYTAGTYAPTFTVIDNQNLSAQASISVNVAPSQPVNYTCTDSDGGQNLFVKGRTTGSKTPGGQVLTYEDICSANSLTVVASEYYCDANNLVQQTGANCPNGYMCQDGACVSWGCPADYKILYSGNVFDVGAYKIRLADVEAAPP
ncbi:MAG: PKD domain-containing protein, partial [Candidatus Micrarchaeota archaeon]|nr:PKD domain-containing protein [Candidatus Micrarchaeota archaeon]